MHTLLNVLQYVLEQQQNHAIKKWKKKKNYCKTKKNLM